MDSLSVMLIIIVGQRPAAERVAVSVAIIMSRLVIGSANKFVMMKYFGKVPKYSHATGPVKIWHDMANAMASHIILGI